jgi:two-component system, NtrC family, C4-dicarboxylate transport response regulator DctD
MKNYKNVIIVEDDKNLAKSLKRNLQIMGWNTLIFEAAEDSIPLITKDWQGILVSDIRMSGMDGLSLMKKALEIDPELPIILITGYADVKTAVQAIKDGAYDFIEKPFDLETFRNTVSRALEKRKYVIELRNLQAKVLNGKKQNEIIGESKITQDLREYIKNIANSFADVLILGETGTGKDLTAKLIHEQSQRSDQPFIPINCGALPETIIESELFGHETGAFTGASQKRIGKFEFANNGTIFLDEIESMPLNLQVKLLRVIQERTIERIGSNKPIVLNIRVIAATKIDLKKASQEGKFREDLFYRLNVVQIALPPLRDRKQDIPILFKHFVAQICARYDQSIPNIEEAFFDNLIKRRWDGNIRELKNEAEKFVLGLNFNFSETSTPTPDDLNPQIFSNNDVGLTDTLAQIEKNIIENELTKHTGSIKKTCEALKIPRQTLRDKMQRYNLQRKNYS